MALWSAKQLQCLLKAKTENCFITLHHKVLPANKKTQKVQDRVRQFPFHLTCCK